MKYMLLVYADEQAWTEAERRGCYGGVDGGGACRSNRGATASHRSAPACIDRDQRPRSRRETDVTDGPFAETREQLGGYFLVEAEDLDEAIAIAGRIPGHAKAQ